MLTAGTLTCLLWTRPALITLYKLFSLSWSQDMSSTAVLRSLNFWFHDNFSWMSMLLMENLRLYLGLISSLWCCQITFVQITQTHFWWWCNEFRRSPSRAWQSSCLHSREDTADTATPTTAMFMQLMWLKHCTVCCCALDLWYTAHTLYFDYHIGQLPHHSFSHYQQTLMKRSKPTIFCFIIFSALPNISVTLRPKPIQK